MRNHIESSGGRRFLMTMGAGITATILQWFGKLDPAGNSYVLIVIGTVAAYITGNTAQKIKAPTVEKEQ
jgi:hypothetical protein